MKTSQFLFLAAVLAVQARAEEEKVIEGEVLQEFNDWEQTLIGLKDEKEEAGNTKHGKTAELLTDEEVDMAATRSVIKIPADMARMAFEDADGLTVAGFFAVNEEGQVKNRDDGSPYQVFRDSTMKNVKMPFAKTTSQEVADAFGVKKMDTMYLLKKNAKQDDLLEIRKCQFFDDLSIFISEDSNNLHGTYHKTRGFEAWGPDRALKHMKGEKI